ncbi:MAG: S9 family peptidase [Flavobacteriales bacterium]
MTDVTAFSQAPMATRKPKNLSIHGHTRIDPYFWLNERENPEVISYLEAENAYTKSGLAHTEALQQKLFTEMKSRIKEDDSSVPVLLRGYYYYTRYETGKEYPIYCRKKGSLDAPEEIMLNENLLAEGQSFCDVVGLTVSPDNNWIAYGADFVGRRKYVLYVKNLLTGETRQETGADTDGGYVWVNDNKTLYYDVKDEVTLRTHRIMRHTVGKDPKKDELIYEEKDETFGCGVSKSKSEAYIFIHSYSTTTSETRFAPANEADAKFRVFQPRVRDHLYDVEHYDKYFYIRTNINGSRNFKIMKTPLAATESGNWTDVMPYRGDVLVERFDVFRDYLVVEERYEGLTRLRVKSWAGSNDYFIQFDEPTYTAYMHSNPEFNTAYFRYGYSSLVQPATVYEINMLSKERKTLKVQEIPGGYDASQYTSERRWVTARDGARVPVSLVYKKSAFKGEDSPLLLYGYGSYGITVDPYFSVARMSLLDRGFVFAIAHIRGGQDLGRQWYETGKMLHKKNTFNDFIDCAEFLISNKYTSRGHLYAMGGSAGGLLMGAVVNMRPDLWNGIVASVPFVDVVTTMLDESIPLTTGEFDEWGNPKNKEYYEYILSYSPYDNIKAVSYPNMLVTTGLHDSQVQYWEPAKWVARLRELKTDNNRLYLHTDMESGHGGKSGRFQRLKEIAMEYAFLLDCEGIKE